MTTDYQAQVERFFFDALELPASEREAFLSASCGAGSELYSAVQALLDADCHAQSFLESPLTGSGGEHPARAGLGLAVTEFAVDHTGSRVGPFRLLRHIGSGGMGVVYLAERVDEAFDQQVAVKLIRRTIDEQEVLRRFDQERRVLARLEHPSIARLIDGGATSEGHPYLAMEYIEGVPIDRYCSDHDLDVDDRLELFRAVCGAVSYAHRNLVVHRDLKPSNILVTPRGEVKLLDFGIAKVLAPEGEGRTGDAAVTMADYRVLTPGYASPEHLRGDSVTTVSDIYSLGVLLYELLTGSSPFPLARKTAQEALDLIRDQSPERPSLRAGVRRLAGDLDNITLKALQMDPDRRYESVEQFSEDLGRHLANLPVQARPDTWRYRTGKFVRRNTAAVAAAGVVVAILLAATAGGVALTVRANRAREIAVAARHEAESQRLAADQISGMLRDMLASVDPTNAQGRDVTLLRELIDGTARRIPRELAGQPLVAAQLHQTLGTTYQNLALYDQAESQYRAGLELRKEALGSAHPDLSESYVSLGSLMMERSRLEDGEICYRRAHTLVRDAFGDRDPRTIRTLIHLAETHQARAQADSAEALYLQVLNSQRELLPPGHVDLAATLNAYGQFLIHQRPAEAGPLLREALSIYRVSSPPLVQTRAMHNLASWLWRHEKAYGESEALFREELGVFREHLAPDHPRLAIGLNNLAGVLEASSRFPEAESAYREALEIQSARLGPDHLDLGTTCNNLARLLEKTGHYAEADSLFQRAASTYRSALGEEHIWVGIVLGNHARLLEAWQHWPEAEVMASDAAAIRMKVWDESHWRTASMLAIQAACRARRGECSAAEPVLLRALDVTDGALGPDHAETRAALKRLAELYLLWGRPESASVYAARIEELQTRPGSQ